jgi:hypothetical protein
VVAPESVSRPSVWAAYPASAAVTRAVLELEEGRQRLAALQAARGVDCPIPVDLRLAGLVEAWAAGCSWEEIMQAGGAEGRAAGCQQTGLHGAVCDGSRVLQGARALLLRAAGGSGVGAPERRCVSPPHTPPTHHTHTYTHTPPPPRAAFCRTAA